MASVTITRRVEWFGSIRRITLEIDGQDVGGVRVNGRLHVDVSPGVHVFQASMDWVGSEPLEVDVSEGDTTMIGVSAPFRRAKAATGMSFPPGNQQQHARVNNGIDIWEYS